jgi:hypothetical protein
MGNFGAENASANYRRQVEREKREADAKRQARAAAAAGRARRQV